MNFTPNGRRRPAVLTRRTASFSRKMCDLPSRWPLSTSSSYYRCTTRAIRPRFYRGVKPLSSDRMCDSFVLIAMPSELLDAITIETGPNPDASVIWMHGLGDDGKGWSEVVPALGLPPTLSVRFIFPHAPMMAVTINNGMRMRAWYDIRQANLSERADLEGVRQSQARVDALLGREAQRGIAARRTLLAGFSQGGAIALHAGLRFAERLAGIVALSTYVIGTERLASEASAANRDVPIFMAHGTHDPVVQLAWAEQSRRALLAQGWNVEWHTYPMEHSAALEEIVAAGRFIDRVLSMA